MPEPSSRPNRVALGVAVVGVPVFLGSLVVALLLWNRVLAVTNCRCETQRISLHMTRAEVETILGPSLRTTAYSTLERDWPVIHERGARAAVDTLLEWRCPVLAYDLGRAVGFDAAGRVASIVMLKT